MTNIILHIGHHKTGSTALQHWLAGNRRVLGESGILYPKLQHNSRFAHHILFPYFFSGDNCDPSILRLLGGNKAEAEKSSAQAWSRLKLEVIKRKPEFLVLSSETFFHVSGIEDMRRFGDALREISSHIEVVLYVRNPAELVLSSISTQYQVDPSFQWPPPDVRRAVIESYQQLQPDIIKVLKFDKEALAGGNIVEDFCQNVLHTDASRPDNFRKNESMSAEALSLMQNYIESRNASRFKPIPLRHRIFMSVLKRVDGIVPGYRKPRLLPGAERSLLKACSDLEWLQSEYEIQWPCPDERAEIDAQPIEYGCKINIAEICHLDPVRRKRLSRSMFLFGAS